MSNPHIAVILGTDILRLQRGPNGCFSRILGWRICRFCLSEALSWIRVMRAARICTVMTNAYIRHITVRGTIPGGTTVPTRSTGMKERTRLRMSISFIPAVPRSLQESSLAECRTAMDAFTKSRMERRKIVCKWIHGLLIWKRRFICRHTIRPSMPVIRINGLGAISAFL